MFKRNHPPYSEQEVRDYIQDIKEMSLLRDKTIQNERLLTKEDNAIYRDEKVRYNEHIKSAQLYLEFILASNEEWAKGQGK